MLNGRAIYLETDYSRFDRTISLPILQQVQDLFFTAVFHPDEYPLVSQCLKLAYKTKGKSDYGIQYDVTGTRCSGDAHTSIGNGLINAFNTYFMLRSLPRNAWESIHEGDDGLIGVDADHPESSGLVAQLGVLGFDVKLDEYNHIDQTSFCGRHHYIEGAAVHNHADIMRSLDKYHTSVSNCREDALILAKSLSYFHTDADTPLLGPLSYALATVMRGKVSFSAAKRALHAIKSERWITSDANIQVNNNLRPPAITAAARASCYRRTGISIERQLAFEAAALSMIEAGEILSLPPIPRDWFIRPDGHVYGDPSTWVRAH